MRDSKTTGWVNNLRNMLARREENMRKPKPDLNDIFSHLREKLKKYSPPLQTRFDDEGRFELWSVKELVIEGRKRRDVFFASLIIQKGYVGFYFMPVYIEDDKKRLFDPALLKLLKGKSCFHIRQLDEGLLQQVESALVVGFQLYQERGWV